MAGNGRFELTSASPDSSFPGNFAQRGAYSGSSLDRSGSFREGSDGRVFNSGKGTLRGSGTSTGDVSSLSQGLMLEPIVLGDLKSRSVELRRILGFSGGSTSEDNSFGAAHLRNSSPVTVEELKKFRASVADTCIRASGRAKKLDEHLHKLSKYFEATTCKKQQRNEQLSNERPGSSSLKMGNQMHRNPSDIVHQKLEDRSKNVILNKRVRTSVAETRAEGRSNALPRQPLMLSKERDMVRDSNMDSDIVEEKIRRLPAGGESWDKKMKRKRSVGAVSGRPIDSDGEPKRTVNHKLTSEPGLQSSDSQSFRSGAPNVTGSINKLDGTLSPASSNARATIKVEQDKSTLSRDVTAGLSKERHLAKGSIKLSNREDSHITCPSPIAKGKASRAPRSSSSTATNAVSNIPRVSGTLESWELSHSINKNSSITGANNRKRAMPSGSSSPPITQWVGQRPQKISRTRRGNLVSPVSNHDELQTPSEGFSPSDFASRLTSSGTNMSLLHKGSAIGAQNVKAKTENVSSPARFSESEESGAGENRFKEKGVASGELEEKAVNAAQSVGTAPMPLKKNKFLVKEEIGDGIRRQGRSGRGSSVSRASMSPVQEKLDSAPTTKPLRSMRPGSDKNGSKSGRPLKKASDRKGFSRLGHGVSAGSPDFTGESDDDREELLTSANLAYNYSLHACSSAFWKKMEGLFASISSEGKSYLSQQLKLAQELQERLSQTLGSGSAIQGDCLHDEISLSDALSGDRSRSTQNKSESREDDSVDQFHGSTLSGGLDAVRRFDHVTPLYQRVLSALIIEDDIEEFDENGWGRCVSLQNAVVASPDDGCFVGAEGKHRDGMEFECESVCGVQAQSNGHANRLFSHHTSSNYGRKSRVLDSPCDGELSQRENGYAHSEVQVLVGLSGCDLDGAQSHRSSSTDCQYEQMCLEDKLLLELHSIGLYPETVPDLHDKEDEVINQEFIQLNSGLYQQVSKKKSCLDKIYEANQGGQDVEGQDLEVVAMNKLVEMAYKKLLATRGSLASKIGMPKVSKQVALAFARRTLARCKKFEDCGVSCFNEPALRDIIFAPPQIIEAEPLAGGGLADTSRNNVGGNTFDTCSNQSDQAFAKNGPILNRGKKKEVLLHDVGGAAIRTTSLGSSLLGGAKGKRSERDVSVRDSITKAGRSSLGNSKGERKTKTKPKQKTAQLSTSGNGFLNKFMETSNPVYPSLAGGSGESINNSGNRKREVGLISPGNAHPDTVKDMKESPDFSNMPLNDIDLPIEELGVGPDMGGNQDFNSWFNFEDDNLQDQDAVGLDIPMDDLSELMF